MAVNFYDVNFNQPGDNSIPAISGYIIDDDAYNNRVSYEGRISEGNIISKAQATSSIAGAISMDRHRITTSGGTLTTCRLQGGNNIGVIYTDTTAQVYICDDDGATIQALTIPWNSNCSNISLVGHFDSNDELDWVSIGCLEYNTEGRYSMLVINTGGFNSTIRDALKPYVYLKYQYPYQVVIQKSLTGTNDFQISRFPAEWFNLKTYGTGEGQSQKYNEIVCRLDPDDLDVWDKSCAWKVVLAQNDYWKDLNNVNLSLTMATYLEGAGYSLGSDILRINSDGTFTNGAGLSQDNLSVGNSWHSNQVEYEIDFNGGKIQIQSKQYIYQWKLNITDSEGNVVDSYDIPVANNGMEIGGTNIYYATICACYLAEHNNHYYLIGLRQFYNPLNDDDGQQIKYNYGAGNYYSSGACFSILKVFNNDANQLLYRATEQEKIVPADPSQLTADETSNQTSDPEHKNEYGQEIPQPQYTSGTWDDGTSEGIRGSGKGQQTGGNSEKTLDQQPSLPGLPTIPTAVSTGFMKLYAPTEAEIQSLCTQLMGDSILRDLQKYLGNNPLDFIVGLQVVPGSFTTDQNNKYFIDYGSYQSIVSMHPITDEFTTIDFGTLDLKEIYGSWEDYNPHTKMSIYLPYLGIKEIDPDRINGTLLSLKYFVDAVTGSILASLTSTRKDSDNDGAEYLVGQWSGQASYTIPLTNIQHNSAVNAVIGIVSATAGLGLAIATGGSTAVMAGAVGGVGGALLSGAKAQKTDITMQGAVSGNLSFFTSTDAYVQIEYPKEGRPDSYDHIVGMPSNISTTLYEQPLDNYIEFVNIDVSGIDAPKNEKQMIVDLLKGGVYS